MSVFVVRAFVRSRELLASNTALARKLDELERKYKHHDECAFRPWRTVDPGMTDSPGAKRRKLGG